jgi:hypothetical protein
MWRETLVFTCAILPIGGDSSSACSGGGIGVMLAATVHPWKDSGNRPARNRDQGYVGRSHRVTADRKMMSATEKYSRNRVFVRSRYVSALLLLLAAATASAQSSHVSCDAITSVEGIVLKSWQRLSTPCRFKPPVEITIVAKTDSTNLRLAYAADQVIFNWELDRNQIRVDGGPANGKHKQWGGAIPTGEYVTIRWVVTSTKQSIYVDSEPRYEDVDDYSNIDRPVTVFAAEGSTVTVKSIVVKRLSGAEPKPPA